MRKSVGRALASSLGAILLAGAMFPASGWAQGDMGNMSMAEGAMGHHGHDMAHDTNMRLHMLLTPERAPTRADSARAAELAREIRAAIAKYRDTTAAVADGYRMFLPNVKRQRVYHFTNNRRAFLEAFRFDPGKPTSLLYEPQADGSLRLIGAMYTAPKRASLDRLDARIPLSIARWHRHVNWCLPPKGEAQRWGETRDGHPLFGPESPVATQAACDAVGGRFEESLFGWMIHANVFLGDDPAVVWGDGH